MRTRVKKWGNSLAIRIPKSYADETRVDEGSDVEIRVCEGALTISPVTKEISLSSLVAGITPKNRHGEFDQSPARGREEW
jgi:antitoxin MazE